MLNWENGLYECEDCHDYEGEHDELIQIVELGSDFDCFENQIVEYYQSRFVCPPCLLNYYARLFALPLIPRYALSLEKEIFP